MYGIYAQPRWGQDGGSVELTGCSLRGNKEDYGTFSGSGTITADGERVGYDASSDDY